MKLLYIILLILDIILIYTTIKEMIINYEKREISIGSVIVLIIGFFAIHKIIQSLV